MIFPRPINIASIQKTGSGDRDPAISKRSTAIGNRNSSRKMLLMPIYALYQWFSGMIIGIYALKIECYNFRYEEGHVNFLAGTARCRCNRRWLKLVCESRAGAAGFFCAMFEGLWHGILRCLLVPSLSGDQQNVRQIQGASTVCRVLYSRR